MVPFTRLSSSQITEFKGMMIYTLSSSLLLAVLCTSKVPTQRAPYAILFMCVFIFAV